MGTFEIINLLGSALLGGIMTIWAQSHKTNLEMKREMWNQRKEKQKLDDESQTKAREYKGTEGFHFTRRAIAIIIILCYFVVPQVSAIWADITIVYGYYDVTQGFWPWSASYESIQWISVGNGKSPILITPMHNNAMLTIMGLFFGNQITK